MDVTADIPGMIIKVKVKPGDQVRAGDLLFVMEAMKMEMEIVSPDGGTVSEVHVRENDVVQAGQVLVALR